jgi:hypothetical protein
MEEVGDLTSLMICKNCRYYEEGKCSLKSTNFEKFSVGLNNYCSEWERDNSPEELYIIINQFLDKYMEMPDESKRIVAVWIIGAILHEDFESYPYLFFNAMKGSGKTRLMKMINSFIDGSLLNSLTEAVLFRTKGGLGIDEFEGITRKGIESLRELLNSAYKKGTKVKRMAKKKDFTGEKMVVEEFDVYRPIQIANISGMEDVLGDRCIQIILERSDNPKKTSLIEMWEKETSFQKFKIIKEKLVQCRLCRDVSIKNIYTEWNDYVLLNVINNTNIIYNTNGTNTTKDTKEVFFNKVFSSGITGRFLELSFPLFLVAYNISDELFEQIIEDFKSIIEIKKEEAISDNSDVSLYDFLSQEVERDGFVFISELTNKFKEFMGSGEDWINEKWVGRALKRLNLLIEKKKVARGRLVKVNYKKAQEKIKMFQQRGKVE